MSLSCRKEVSFNKLSNEPELSKKYPAINCHMSLSYQRNKLSYEPELSKKYPVINSHMSLSYRRNIL